MLQYLKVLNAESKIEKDTNRLFSHHITISRSFSLTSITLLFPSTYIELIYKQHVA